MGIKCMADNYSYKKEGDNIIVYNQFYDNDKRTLLISAIFEMFIPDTNSFNIPVAIQICDLNNDITINKNLEVTGCSKYYYYIPREHYEKWKKSYALIYYLLIVLQVFVSGLLFYIYVVPAKFNILAGVIFGCVFFMLILLIYKFKKQKELVKKYQLR